MALRGNLKDFSLPDVFQLITFSRKTGVLRIVRKDGARGAVWFRDGEVFFASSNWRNELLGERLVRAQKITPQALARALEIKSREPADGRRLGQILIEEGYITESVLEAFVNEQIQDTIFDLMRWDEGEFDFEAMPEAVEEDIGLSVSIENVVMEGSRRLEEWNRIKKKIPSMDVVFKMATAPGEGTFEISLKPIEWQILLLTDGSRSVAELAQATQRTDFEVARIVYGLLSAGLLEFATDEEIERARAERAEREARLAEIEAARRAEEEAQARAALEREAALAREAEARLARETARQAPAAGPAHVEPPPMQPGVPGEERVAEEPEFLGAAAPPSADDVSVLEEVMGAVLDQARPAAQRAETPPAPVEEPAFIAAGAHEGPETPVMQVPAIEEILPEFESVVPAAPPAPAEPAAGAPGPEVPAAEPELTAGEPEAPALEPEVTAGEPEAPVREEPPEVPTPEPEVSPVGPVLEEPVPSLGAPEAEAAAVQPAPAATPAAQAPSRETQAGAAAPDFSHLLASLEAEAEPAGAPEAAARGFDASVLASDDVVLGGVISTDAYLEDIGDLSLSGGLTDEISALTGAERRKPARPQASVRAIPEHGQVLQRDARVDKDTVMKIIEGLKNL